MTTLNDQNFREELGIEIGNVRMKQKAESKGREGRIQEQLRYG